MDVPPAGPLDLRAILKEIGRGAHGARDLDRDTAQRLFAAMLDGTVPEMELGAILLAYRIKGETAEELQGFEVATRERTLRIAAPVISGQSSDSPRPGVVPVLLPSYNGARKLPNLTPLTALLLAARGVPALIHGVAESYGRVTTEAVMEQLRLPVCHDGDEIEEQLRGRGVAYAPLEVLCPGLAALIATRERLGVRGPAHTVAKLVDPFAGESLRVVPLTHPPYFPNMRTCLSATGSPALLMRGSEGEPTAGPKRPLAVEYIRGSVTEELQEPRPDEVPLPALDVVATARWTEEALEGRVAVPATVQRFVEWCARFAMAQAGSEAPRAAAR